MVEFLVVATMATFVAALIIGSNKKETNMKTEQYEINKQNRKDRDNFEKLLVKLEEEFGDEYGAPYVTTVIKHHANEVWFNATQITTWAEAKRVVKEAKKVLEVVQPTLSYVSDIKVDVSPNVNGTYAVSYTFAGKTKELPEVAAEDIQKFTHMYETKVVNNIGKFYNDITDGRAFYEASQGLIEDLTDARKAHRIHLDNKDKIEKKVVKGNYSNSYFAASETKRLEGQYSALISRATELGFKIPTAEEAVPFMLKLGQTISIELGNPKKQRMSHIPRTAALRYGMTLPETLKFTIDSEANENGERNITLDDGTKAIAGFKVDEVRGFKKELLCSFRPFDGKAYWDKHEWIDTYNKLDTTLTIQDLINLGLWNK